MPVTVNDTEFTATVAELTAIPEPDVTEIEPEGRFTEPSPPMNVSPAAVTVIDLPACTCPTLTAACAAEAAPVLFEVIETVPVKLVAVMSPVIIWPTDLPESNVERDTLLTAPTLPPISSKSPAFIVTLSQTELPTSPPITTAWPAGALAKID